MIPKLFQAGAKSIQRFTQRRHERQAQRAQSGFDIEQRLEAAKTRVQASVDTFSTGFVG
jgi:hypothetical protein